MTEFVFAEEHVDVGKLMEWRRVQATVRSEINEGIWHLLWKPINMLIILLFAE